MLEKLAFKKGESRHYSSSNMLHPSCVVTMAINTTKNSKAFTIISSYSSPYANFREILDELTDLTTNINGEEYLIGGDFNAHSQRWGYRDEDSRGNNFRSLLQKNTSSFSTSVIPLRLLNTTINKAGPT
ncbi:hypothetical protein AVEN_92578-1 [Araneus ventricosus]|uniref:Endonuclease/exonuclease/phosphatase domain-containing protein n=1 Tax=Araneus ventricosus TaxID=182803 RepID=A0A4Y2AJD4_ARAVE|nr:hypothetical protein AVEN_92578-1 [Araneus ventricosus]